jgi:hypothetical protein
MSLNIFLANVNKKNGFAKSNRFSTVITIPSALQSILNGIRLGIVTEASELPGRSLITGERKIYGPVTKMPYQTQYNEVTLNFICTNTFDERAFFEAWIDYIMPVQGEADATRNVRFKDSYSTTVEIYQYDERENIIHNVSLIEAFPVTMATQSLNWSDDGFHRLSVQFAYSHYKTKSPSSSVTPPTKISNTPPSSGNSGPTPEI